MSSLSLDTPVADLVTDDPSRARIFERLGLDYCCGGDRSLADACRQHDLDPETVLRMLEAVVDSAPAEAEPDWTDRPLPELIDHIIDTHHEYLRRELPRLNELLDTVTRAHGDDHSWLRRVRSVFRSLKADLNEHMQSEEEYVFPAIRTLAEGRVLPDGSTLDASAVEQMETEHDEAGSALDTLRTLTDDYTPPADACPKLRTALESLRELEADLHQHVHKENNILFPRARSLA